MILFREGERAFAAGDRVQMTAPDRERGIPNRELGTVERIDTSDAWKSAGILADPPHSRQANAAISTTGYAVTSHGSQGQTAGRVLVHVETARACEKLVNQRLGYVAVSRGQYDARIYTDDKVGLARWIGTSRIDQRLRERPCKEAKGRPCRSLSSACARSYFVM